MKFWNPFRRRPVVETVMEPPYVPARPLSGPQADFAAAFTLAKQGRFAEALAALDRFEQVVPNMPEVVRLRKHIISEIEGAQMYARLKARGIVHQGPVPSGGEGKDENE